MGVGSRLQESLMQMWVAGESRPAHDVARGARLRVVMISDGKMVALLRCSVKALGEGRRIRMRCLHRR